jgi:hypothetical protein
MRPVRPIVALVLLMLAAACSAAGNAVSVDGIAVTKVRAKALRRGAEYHVSFEVKNATKSPKIVALKATLATLYYKTLESPSDTIVLRKGETKKMVLTIAAPPAESADGASQPALGPYQIPTIEILSVKEAPKF